MRDRLFFPLAAILAGTFVFMALNPLAERLPTGPVSGGGRNVMDLTVQGDELHRFVAGNYNGITFEHAANGQPALLRVTRKAGEDYQDPRSGAHLVLAEDLEYAYEKLKAKGVEFAAPPTKQPWGTFATFRDPDGNTFVLSSL